MGDRVYVAQIDGGSTASVLDIFSLKAGSANGIEIRQIYLGATGQTAASELRLSIKRFTSVVTAGTGGTAPSAIAVQSGDTKAATATVRANDTASMTTNGSSVVLESFTWNVLLPFEYTPGPEASDRDQCQAAEGFSLTLNAAQTVTWSGYIKWRELP